MRSLRLVLVRRIQAYDSGGGECLLIDDNLKLKVLDIDKDQIKICVNALKVVTLYQHESTTISDEIKITVFKIILDQFNIAIEAPEGTTINRK